MTTAVRIPLSVVIAIHEEQIAEHGGAGGVRDADLLAAALARPDHLAAYGDPDLADLAAAYGYGLVRNHAFVDGNKRTGAVVMELFLALHGVELRCGDDELVRTILALAGGNLSQEALAAWIRQHTA